LKKGRQFFRGETPKVVVPERRFCHEVYPRYSSALTELFLSNDCVVATFAGQLYADLVGQFVRFDYELIIPGQPIQVQTVWIDGNAQEGYTYDWKTGNCVAAADPYPIGGNNLPNNTVLVDKILMGTELFDVLWAPSFPSGYDGISSEVTLSSGSCLPISIVMVNTTSSAAWITDSYYNFVNGVSPYLLTIPQNCLNATRESLAFDAEANFDELSLEQQLNERIWRIAHNPFASA
jgi:hypothetical protein